MSGSASTDPDVSLLKNCVQFETSDAWRNITTASPSIDPFDDILSTASDRDLARAWEGETNGLDKAKTNRQSPFAYGDKAATAYVFGILKGGTRFCSEGFGTWYGAEDEETSIWEAMHYLYRSAKEDLSQAQNGLIRFHRRMYKAELKASKSIDLRPLVFTFPGLVDPYDYTVPRKFGQFAVANQIQLFRTQSVRRTTACCVVAFDRSALIGDKPVFEYYLTFKKGSDRVQLEKLGKRSELSFPKAAWDAPMNQ